MADHVECDKHEMIGCTLCSGKEKPKIPRVKPLKYEWPQRQAPVDPDVRIATEVAAGILCGSCLTRYEPIGCQCSRDRLYQADMLAASSWTAQQIEDGIITDAEAPILLLPAQRRGQRRNGMTEVEATDDRTGLMAEFGIKPLNWRQYRRTEANHLPV